MRRHWWGQCWPWRGSKDRELPTFWHSNLLQEAGVLTLLLLLFAASGAAALAELRRRYIAVYLAEAEKVELTLSDQLQQAREELIQFSQLPGPLRNGQTARLLTDFSELYQLNPQLRITRIIKRLPGSQVFRGFSLSRSPLVGYLQQSRSTTVFSPLLRGFEDSRASIYIALPDPAGLLLGRLNLEALQRLLQRFSSTAQTPVLLVARDGSVLLSSDPTLYIPAFPLDGAWQQQVVAEPLVLEGRRWIPIVTPASSVGAAIVTLVPTERLADEQRMILVLLLSASLASGILVALKSLRMRRRFIQPIAELADHMRRLEASGPAQATPTAGVWPETPASFAELDTIQTAFAAMVQAIRQREQQLRRLASCDALTGLLNRRALLEQLETLLAHPEWRGGGEGLALLFCDLDLFKEINDNLGHAAGDRVLRTVVERIRACIRSGDLAARMGGDEIVVVLRSIPDLEAAMAIAETVCRAIAEPITTAELHIEVTASIGVTMAKPEESVDALIARADVAMYGAKQAGRNRVTRLA